ncbi:YHYH protein [Salinibacterium sp. SWN1162]|uniref:YHYH protein n=1 Tax=Salinibacterium sp. SWN1162 TaxID=2792053 RepID=UPI0018CDE309|nr:YHYH protein [Salinibacterium sp. SWN1162]MBH0009434.1 YHYH protein [Salinibacterium sp. SWN1162]
MRRRFSTVAATSVLLLALAGCTAAESTDAETSTPTVEATESATTATTATFAASNGDCDAMAATLRDVESANADLADPELAAVCDGDTLTISSNSIPDYLYIATTPGSPKVSELTMTIPVTPTEADEPSAVPYLGALGVAVNGVPIYGPTEGTGGDVQSLEGALSVCGSHSGPTDFHIHWFGYADGVDCLYDADEAETGESLVVGWAADGYPIMSGVVCSDDECSKTTQLTSSWELTDESQFATDTWAAHSYVEGSGDLDECNGRVDSDGQYRYYATPTFPYFLGCYHGDVADDALSGNNAAAPGGGPA